MADKKTPAPLGRRGTRHMVIEYDGNMWLSLAPDGGGALFGGAAARNPGLLVIEPLLDGKALAHTYEIDKFKASCSAEGGGKITLAIDGEANAVRIEGEGCGVRFDSRGGDGMGNSTYNLPGGIDITVGGGRYFFVVKKGTYTFDDTWVLAAFGSKRPILDVTPVDGKFEVLAYELPPDTEPKPVSKTLSEVIEANKADYYDFVSKLIDVPEEYMDLLSSVAYTFWTSLTVRPNGGVAVVANRLSSPAVVPNEQVLAALAVKDPDLKADLLISAEKASPPIAGYAAQSLASKVTRSKFIPLHQSLLKTAEWWRANRCRDGQYFYAYRHETGERNPAFFAIEAPIESPALYVYISLLFHAVSECESALNNTYAARLWEERSLEAGHKLKHFAPDVIARNMNTGDEFKSEGINYLFEIDLIGNLFSSLPESGSDNAIAGAFELYKAASEVK